MKREKERKCTGNCANCGQHASVDKNLVEAYLEGKDAGAAIATKKAQEELTKLQMQIGELTRRLMERGLI
jgi:hypothetical protein